MHSKTKDMLSWSMLPPGMRGAIDPLPRVCTVPGFRLFVTGDAYDTGVDLDSQDHYEQIAKKVSNRAADAESLPICHIVRTCTDITNGSLLMSAPAARKRARATGSRVDTGSIEAENRNVAW